MIKQQKKILNKNNYISIIKINLNKNKIIYILNI